MLIKTNILLIALFILSIYTVSFTEWRSNAIANNENGNKYYPDNISLNTPLVTLNNSSQEIVDQVWQAVNNQFVDSNFNGVDWQKVRKDYSGRNYQDSSLAYAAIDEMLALLEDPFTKFMTPNEFEVFKLSLSQNQIATGLNLSQDKNTQKIKVDFASFGSPAFVAGINHGDLITQIDGQNTEGMNISQTLSLLREKQGKIVPLVIERNGTEMNFEIANKIREIESVNWQIQEIDNSTIAYIHVNQFNEYAAKDIEQAIAEAESQQVEGYVVDLRWNPGGIISSAIDITSMWLKEGTIVTIVNRDGIYARESATNKALTDKPLVVIVNHDSASASEIIASALQQNSRAIIVGEKTRGNGSIQSVEQISDNSGLALTIGKFLSPNGNEIQNRGIQPDLKVEPTATEITKLKRNLARLATEEDLMWVKAVKVLKQAL